MPVSLSAIQSKTRSVALTYEGDTITIWYSPSTYTPRYLDEVAAAQEAEAKDGDAGGEGHGRKLAELACQIVRRWDITDDDGAEMPVTVETMMELPLSIINDVFEAVGKDAAEKKGLGGATSSGGSLA